MMGRASSQYSESFTFSDLAVTLRARKREGERGGREREGERERKRGRERWRNRETGGFPVKKPERMYM